MSISWSAISNLTLKPSTLSLLALAALSGCATRSDLEQVKKSQREVRQLVANYTVALDEVRRRMDMVQTQREGAPGKSGSADPELRRRVDRLEADLAALQNRQPQAALGGAAPQDSAPVVEQDRPTGAAPWPAAADANPPTGAPAVAAAGSDDLARWLAAEEATATDPEYKGALVAIRQGQCKDAVPTLRNVIRKGGKSPAGDHAQYLIGSCFYRDKDYNRAIVELYEVLQKYPNGDRLPASLLLLADAFAASDQKVDARLILQKLVKDHPDSPEAQKGKQKLQALGE